MVNLSSVKRREQKKAYVSRVSYDRIARAEKTRKTSVVVAWMRIVREHVQCGDRYQGVVDSMKKNVIYEGREAPQRRCVKIEPIDLTNSGTLQ